MIHEIKAEMGTVEINREGRMLSFPLKNIDIDPGELLTEDDFNFHIGGGLPSYTIEFSMSVKKKWIGKWYLPWTWFKYDHNDPTWLHLLRTCGLTECDKSLEALPANPDATNGPPRPKPIPVPRGAK